MASSTIRSFYIFNAFKLFGVGIYTPLAMLYPLSLGFDMASIAFLFSIRFIAQLAMEVPTGIVADRFSRRGSVVIGQVLAAITMVMFVLSDSFVVFACAFTLMGLGAAFSSGAMGALTYDALKFEGRDKDFQRIVGTGQSIGIVSVAIGSAVCGIVVSYFGMVAVPWISAAFYGLGGLAVMMIPEPPFLIDERQQQTSESFSQVVSGYLQHLVKSILVVRSSAALQALSAVQAIFLVPLGIIQHYYAQPYLALFDYSAAHISYIYTFFYFVEAVLSKYSMAIRSLIGSEHRTYAVITSLVLVSIVAMTHAPTGLIVVASLVAMRIATGVVTPTIQESLNRRLDSSQRASCLSLIEMGRSLLWVICLLFFGHIADSWSLRASMWSLEIMFVPLLILTWIAGRWLREQPTSTVMAKISS